MTSHLKDVCGGELQELHAQLVPALCVVGEESQLVVLVHGDHAGYPLLLN
jgi:hypothetical protein